MNVRFPFVVLLSVVVLSLGFVAGCGSEDAAKTDENEAEGVDPHDVPITDEQKEQLREETAKFADAVARVKKLRDAVEKETKDGIPENPFEAHQALDLAAILTGWLPEIARNSGASMEQLEKTVTPAANELGELFDKIHLNIDDKKDPGFASVREQMDTRIAELEALTIPKE